ncbi:MAG: hypothetical protein PF904_11520 [Kiritimatiellae bacterium]|jgi:hypothetical protein|nr:hypothetical protein [Kiritimatiellia bacterium]
MRIFLKSLRAVVSLAALFCACSAQAAAVPNGNDYALEVVEASTPADIKEVLAEGVGRKHLFRYLEVLDIKKGNNKGAPVIGIKAREPSSDMIVKFLVQKSISLSIIQKTPSTQVGDGVAVTGVVESVDPKKKTMVLNPVIVRYKDRTTPKVGREMMEEVDDSSIIYSFTAGKKPVNLTKRDEDLIADEKKMVKELGADAWAAYLLREISKRDKAERIKRNKLDIYRKK